jgi:CRISPR-associated endoribonuclease Cas6
MRLYIRTTPNTESVPFDHQHRLTGVFHKCFGAENIEHTAIGLAELSR